MNMSVFDENELVNELQSGRVMHWNYRKYNSLPPLLRSQGQHVTDLYVKSNNLTALPSWIDQLTNLTEIYLDGNRLTSLPENVGGLINLRVLHVNENLLSHVPKALGQLKNLNDINLEGNRLEVFPSELRCLKAVFIVNLRRNRISMIPDWLIEMVSLQELIIDYNFLTSLPLNIVYLKSLTYLSVSSNELLYLPFLPFYNEVTLEFWGNPTLNYIWPCLFEIKSNVAQCMGIPRNLRNKLNTSEPLLSRKIPNMSLFVAHFNETITLPLQIERLTSCHDLRQPSSLLELCLRAVHQLCFEVDGYGGRRCIRPDITNDLPVHLKKCVRLGPFARCVNCRVALFSEGSIDLRCIDKKFEGLRDTVCTHMTAEFYCLSKCSNRNSIGCLEWTIVGNLKRV